jgi:hypothetical protein
MTNPNLLFKPQKAKRDGKSLRCLRAGSVELRHPEVLGNFDENVKSF